MNHLLQEFARRWLKERLSVLPERNQEIFKRMYSPFAIAAPIDRVVDQMPEDKLDWAMTQVENTVNKPDVIGDALRALPVAGVINVDNPRDPRHKEWKL